MPASTKVQTETFTVAAWLDPITRGLSRPQLSAAAMLFGRGLLTGLHTHEGGQTCYASEGRGYVQARR